MKIFRDFAGRSIRLTNERLKHILDHPEMAGMSGCIKQTLSEPHKVIQSVSDPQARLYYRFYISTRVGDKYLCVVVKVNPGDAFILTAYFTDTIKKGEIIWLRK